MPELTQISSLAQFFVVSCIPHTRQLPGLRALTLATVHLVPSLSFMEGITAPWTCTAGTAARLHVSFLTDTSAL